MEARQDFSAWQASHYVASILLKQDWAVDKRKEWNNCYSTPSPSFILIQKQDWDTEGTTKELGSKDSS